MRQPDLDIPVHDGSLFTWNKGEGVTEASDLDHLIFSKIWYDSCDGGFFIKSHRTGIQKLFYLAGEEKDPEGDLQAWLFRSEDGVIVRVFND